MRRVSLWIGMWLALALLARGQSLPNLAEVEWEPARNSDQTIARFEIAEQDGRKALHVTQDSPSGYSFYRTFTKLAPGDYTLKVHVYGKAEKQLLMQCYTFDAANKPRLLIYKLIPAADLAPNDHYVTFTVPEGSVSQRFDLGIAVYRWLAREGYCSLVFRQDAPMHTPYLKKIGYQQNGAGDYVLNLADFAKA